MKYLIIDAEYRIYQSAILTGYIRSQARKGNLSIVDLKVMKGLNAACSEEDKKETWSPIQEWLPEFKVDAA